MMFPFHDAIFLGIGAGGLKYNAMMGTKTVQGMLIMFKGIFTIEHFGVMNVGEIFN